MRSGDVSIDHDERVFHGGMPATSSEVSEWQSGPTVNEKERARLRDIIPVCVACGAYAALSFRVPLLFDMHRIDAAMQNAIATEAVLVILLVTASWATGRGFSAVVFVAFAILAASDVHGGNGIWFFLFSPSVFAYLLFRLINERAVIADDLPVLLMFLGVPLATIVALLLLFRL